MESSSWIGQTDSFHLALSECLSQSYNFKNANFCDVTLLYPIMQVSILLRELKRILCFDWLPERARWAHHARSGFSALIPQEKVSFFLYNNSVIDQDCLVKMAGLDVFCKANFRKICIESPLYFTTNWHYSSLILQMDVFILFFLDSLAHFFCLTLVFFVGLIYVNVAYLSSRFQQP